MKPLVLYLRSRGVPATAAVVAVCAIGLWALGLAIDNVYGRSLAALLLALAATTALAPGLIGSDVDIDRVSAIAWPPRRAAHIAVGGAIVVGSLAATALAGDPMAPLGQISRNVAGLAGLVALGAAVLGAARAPLLPVLWTVLVLRYAPPMGTVPTRPVSKVALTWMVQPDGTRAATATAVVLAVVGTVAYAITGSRR